MHRLTETKIRRLAVIES